MKTPSREQIFIFLLVWFAYASTYILRKLFGVIKGNIQSSFDLSEKDLGYIDLAFSLPYALVSLIFGNLGDKIGPIITLGGGLLGSAVATSFMAFASYYWILLSLLFVSGTFQALTWPAACNIISSWFSEEIRTSVMGVFGTSLLAGNIVGTLITVYTAEAAGWRNVFYLPSFLTVLSGLSVLYFIRTKDKSSAAQIKTQDAEKSSEPQDNKKTKSLDTSGERLSALQILKLPLVFQVSLSLFCVKAVRNAVMFWLPYYLTDVLNYNESTAGLISLLFEIGGFIGSVTLTGLTDKYMAGKDLLTTALACIFGGVFSASSMLTQKFGPFILYSSLFLCGAFISTADIIICGSVSTKLGEKHGAKSSTVGVINGIGSLGNIAEGPVVALLTYWFGMIALVPFIAVSSCIASILSFTAELVRKKEESKNSRTEDQS